MRHRDGSVDRLIAEIASSSQGVVARRTLLANGVSPAQLRSRLKRGSLIAVHPGIYRVGHQAPSVEASYLAAVLACGDGALLAARPAGHLWGLIKGTPPRPEVIALVKLRLAGVTTHRVRRLYAQDAARRRGIPVTAVPRTLVDLACVLSERLLARACHEAEVRYDVTPAQVEEVLERLPTRRGVGALRRILHGDLPVTISTLEDRFLAVLAQEDLPMPETNRPAGGHRVDCRWPDLRVTVELDGYRYHGTRHAWEIDRRREREAYARGDQFRRYTWGDVFEDPQLMAAELHTLLPSRRAA